jgi:hypothetical protein
LKFTQTGESGLAREQRGGDQKQSQESHSNLRS